MKYLTYYHGSFYSKSTAMNLYELSKQLNRNNKQLLWFWIVGLSNLMVHQKIGQMEYDEEIQLCNEEVCRLHPSEHNKEYNKDFNENNEDAANALVDQDGAYQGDQLFKLVNRQTENQEVGTILME